MTKSEMTKIKENIARLKKKIKSWQTLNEAIQEEVHDDSFPSSPFPNIKTNDVVYMVINKDEISTAYTDLTGRFPCKSSSGNEYVMVAYHYDANIVMRRALQNRKAETITATW